MQLTLEDNIRIQQFLLERGFIQDVPDGFWNFNKSSGYRTYLETQPIPQADVNEVPHKIEMLTKELQDFLLIPSLVSNTLENDLSSELDNEENSNTGNEENSGANDETESENESNSEENDSTEETESENENSETSESDEDSIKSQSFSITNTLKNLVKPKVKKDPK